MVGDSIGLFRIIGCLRRSGSKSKPITLALTYIPSGQAALLGFTMPLWAALWSWLLFGHTLDGRQWLALLLGTAGVIVLMIPAFASYAHSSMCP